MPNQLAAEISPYLLQHAENPVEWHPWNEAALARARAENKPIFLSIGYSACHWCHVMAHESFEDQRIAAALREGFISIKVDREERPDLDQIYMEAVQAMTGQGGWPLSVFLTPDLKPFFGGTYWPERARRGMPGFDQVLAAVLTAWRDRRGEIDAQAEQITRYLRENPIDGRGSADAELDDRPLRSAVTAARQSFDAKYGGFGGAPKFPAAITLCLLVQLARRAPQDDVRAIVATTLDRMADGGLYDHLGGGFHRYSVDARWLVPHFEKMLYDNALLARCYLEAYQWLDAPRYAEIARQTLDYVLRDMTDAGGGFYASEDADSEGVEGKFYVWTSDEIRDVLGPEAAATFGRVYGVTEQGNFEGANILHRAGPLGDMAAALGRNPDELAAELAESREKLRQRRNARVRPGRDDKVLANWNGLMIDALARAGAILGEPRYTAAAMRGVDFLSANLRDAQGRLRHCWRNGQTRGGALLDDYAALAEALVTLHRTQGDARWLTQAAACGDEMLARFAAPEGGFFCTPHDHEPLIARKKDMLDTPVPSGNGLAAAALVRLARATGRDDFAAAARRTLALFSGVMRQLPTGMGQLLLALELYLQEAPAAADSSDS